jgi:hypothetical protein
MQNTYSQARDEDASEANTHFSKHSLSLKIGGKLMIYLIENTKEI